MPERPQRRRLRRLACELHGSHRTAVAGGAESAILARDIEVERRRIATQNATRAKGLTASDWQRLGMPFPVLDVVDGAVPQHQLRELEGLRDAAATRHDFREAALYHDLLTSLGPQHVRSAASRLSECLALQSAEERAVFFLAHGFCVIKAFTGTTLRKMQDAWLLASDPVKREWEQAVTRDGARLVGGSRADLFFDIPDILEQDDVFLETVNQPEVAEVLHHVIGDNVRCWQSLARTLPATTDRAGDDPLARAAYSTWHRDSTGAPDSWLLPEHRVVKTFTYLFDVSEDGGCTTLVPGTHRLPGGPRETIRCRFAGAANDFGLAAAGAAEQGDVEPVAASSMPNQLPIAVEAGTVFCFDNSVWHTVSLQQNMHLFVIMKFINVQAQD